MTDTTLSNPKNEQELFDAMNKAVSEGDSKEVDRLMAYELPSTETSPDASSEQQDDTQQSAQQADDKQGETQTQEQKDEQNSVQNQQVADDKSATQPQQPAQTQQTQPPAQLTPEQIQALVQRVHRLESDAGRVGNLQSQIADLKKELRRKSKAAEQAAADQPSEEQRKFQERIKALKTIDPEGAELLELQQAQIEALRKATSAAKKDETDDDDQGDAGEEAARAALRRDLDIVEQVHPDAVAVFQHPAWSAWKATLTPEQLAWATSSQPGHVISALTAFKHAYANQNRAVQQQQSQANPPAQQQQTTAQNEQQGNEQAAAVQQQRDRKLQDTGNSRNTPIKGQTAVDTSSLFSEMYEKIMKDNHIG